MRLGAVFPTTEIGTDPVVIRDWAQTAEGLGYDHIVAFDHVLGAEHAARDPKLSGPYTDLDPFHEPFALFAYLAGVTQRIELTTGVIILPQRQTALVAKQAAEIDLLSQGRLRLGVGTGWNWIEYESLGVPFDDRGRRFDEQIELLRRLWTEPLVEFEGDFHRVARASILPRPERAIPIWFGALAPVAVKRAARVGDGLLFATAPSLCQRMLGLARAELDRAGRDAAAFGLEACVDFSAGAEHWVEEHALWRECGGTHLTLRAMDVAAEFVGAKHMGYRGPQDYIDVLKTFRDAVG